VDNSAHGRYQTAFAELGALRLQPRACVTKSVLALEVSMRRQSAVMNRPDLHFTRASQPSATATTHELYASALERAVEIERLLERAHEAASGDGRETYQIRLAQAICASLVGELGALSAGTPRNVRRMAKAGGEEGRAADSSQADYLAASVSSAASREPSNRATIEEEL
jgi:hypothetical protein